MSESKAKIISKPCLITGIVLAALSLLFGIYLTAVMVYRTRSIVQTDTYMKIFRYEILICAIWLLGALSLIVLCTRSSAHSAGRIILKVIAGIIALLGLSLLGFTCFVGIRGFVSGSAETKNALVLGMALENGKPNQDLLNRVKRAEEYLSEHPDSMLICTGGNKTETSPSEAEVMKDLLMQDGVAEDKIILEDQASMTLANFRNTAKMIDPNAPVTVITNSYHMHRSLYFAKKAGFTNLNAAPAKSDPVFYGANLMWEVVSLIDQMLPRSGKQSAPPPASSAADSMPADSSAAQ